MSEQQTGGHFNGEKADAGGKATDAFYEMLDAIRPRPAMWIGNNSLDRLVGWLGGWDEARRQAGTAPTPGEVEFYDRDHGFNDFVCREYQWRDRGGWYEKIAYYNEENVEALEEFFRLVDRFRASRGRQSDGMTRDDPPTV